MEGAERPERWRSGVTRRATIARPSQLLTGQRLIIGNIIDARGRIERGHNGRSGILGVNMAHIAGGVAENGDWPARIAA